MEYQKKHTFRLTYSDADTEIQVTYLPSRWMTEDDWNSQTQEEHHEYLRQVVRADILSKIDVRIIDED